MLAVIKCNETQSDEWKTCPTLNEELTELIVL